MVSFRNLAEVRSFFLEGLSRTPEKGVPTVVLGTTTEGASTSTAELAWSALSVLTPYKAKN